MFPALLGSLALGAAGSAGGSMIGDMFLGGGKNPYDAASPYLEQIPGVSRQYMSPYIGRGMEAEDRGRNELNRGINQYTSTQGQEGNIFPDEFRQMARDPRGFLDSIMQSYNPSKGYQYKRDRQLGAMRNSAAAGGFAGTQYDQEQQGELSNQLLNKDMQQYLENVLGIQDRGLGGEERRLTGRAQGLTNLANYEMPIGQRGFDASSNLMNSIAQALTQQGGAAFQGQRRQNENRASARTAGMNFMGSVLGVADPFKLAQAGGR